MPPKLLSDDKKNIVIRPLSYCKEKDIAEFARLKEFPIIPCNLCGSQENLQRQNIKQMLIDWEKTQPGRSENIFRSIANIAPSQLADNELFDFRSLQQQQERSHLGERLPLFNLDSAQAQDVEDDTEIKTAKSDLADAVQSFQP